MQAGLRFVFVGTPRFAARSLQALLQEGELPCSVITRPDRPVGRGLRKTAPPVKQVGLRHGIPVMQPQKLSSSEGLKMLRDLAPDLMVVVAFGEILKRPVLEVPRLGCVNLHASLLPRHRGAAPVPWTILSGDETTGVTTFLLDEGMDSGPILLCREVPIAPDDTSGTLGERLSEAGAGLLVQTVRELAAGTVQPVPQDPGLVTYAPKIRKADGALDWTKPADRIERQVRAFDPWPGSWGMIARDGGRTTRLRLFEAEALPMEGVVPGGIRAVDPSGMVVGTGNGAVRFARVQAEGGRRIRASEYARGHALRVGMRFVQGHGGRT